MRNRKKLSRNYFLLALLSLGLIILFILILKSQESWKVKKEIKNEIILPSDNSSLLCDFPILNDLELITSAESDDHKGKSYIWEVRKEKELVFENIKSELRLNGWEVVDNFSSSESLTFSFKNDRCDGFAGVFLGEKGKSLISVTIKIN